MKLHYGMVMFSLVLMVQGCTHGAAKRRLDEKVAEETQVKSSSDIAEKAEERIQSVPGLTEDQRSRLSALKNSTRSELEDLSQQSLRLRSLLVKDLISENYDELEVRLIKKRIRKVESKRVSAILNAVDQVNVILGRQAANNRRMMDEFLSAPHGNFY